MTHIKTYTQCLEFKYIQGKRKDHNRKTAIVLIHGIFWFPCVNSPESAVCYMTGINIGKGLRV